MGGVDRHTRARIDLSARLTNRSARSWPLRLTTVEAGPLQRRAECPGIEEDEVSRWSTGAQSTAKRRCPMLAWFGVRTQQTPPGFNSWRTRESASTESCICSMVWLMIAPS
jgi:hypothetical protein